HRPINIARLHEPVDCGYNYHEVHGQTILQLETYGSVERKMPGKVSQSIQLNEDGARKLKRILNDAFPSL
ncbi:MAG: hypothetical protein ACREX3_14325, partial [Gammaproteobacteria bacterium]